MRHHFWRKPRFFGLFYLKSYNDEIWYVGTLCDLENECRPWAFLWARTPFFVLLAVGELFVRAGKAHSQARSACGIARRRRVLIRPKAERFTRRRRALWPGAKRP